MKSQLAVDLLVNAEKARLRDVVAKSRGELTAIVGVARAAQEAKRLEKAKLVPGPFAAEIRSVVRNLELPAKLLYLANAIKAKDSAAVAAIVDAPPILSGLSAQQLADFRADFLDTMAPGRRDEAAEMQSICDAVLRTTEEAAQPVGAFRPTANGIADGAAAAATPPVTATAA